jgi:hypothetical protein
MHIAATKKCPKVDIIYINFLLYHRVVPLFLFFYYIKTKKGEGRKKPGKKQKLKNGQLQVHLLQRSCHHSESLPRKK